MNQVCKNVEEKGKLLGYVLSRFRVDVSMESPFQFFFCLFLFPQSLRGLAIAVFFQTDFIYSCSMCHSIFPI